MEIIKLSLINKRKNSKYIRFKVKGLNGYNRIKNVDVRIFCRIMIIPSCYYKDYYDIFDISLKYFYWLLNDDIDLIENKITYEEWKKWVEKNYVKYNFIQTDYYKNIAIQSYYTYKENYEKI